MNYNDKPKYKLKGKIKPYVPLSSRDKINPVIKNEIKEQVDLPPDTTNWYKGTEQPVNFENQTSGTYPQGTFNKIKETATETKPYVTDKRTVIENGQMKEIPVFTSTPQKKLNLEDYSSEFDSQGKIKIPEKRIDDSIPNRVNTALYNSLTATGIDPTSGAGEVLSGVLSPLFTGLEQMQRGNKEKEFGRELTDNLLGLATIGIGSIPSMIGVNSVMPVVSKVSGDVAEDLGMRRETGEQVGSLLAFAPFGKKIMLAGLTSTTAGEFVSKLLEDTSLNEDDKERIIETAHHAGFFAGLGAIGLTKQVYRNVKNRQDINSLTPGKIDKQQLQNAISEEIQKDSDRQIIRTLEQDKQIAKQQFEQAQTPEERLKALDTVEKVEKKIKEKRDKITGNQKTRRESLEVPESKNIEQYENEFIDAQNNGTPYKLLKENDIDGITDKGKINNLNYKISQHNLNIAKQSGNYELINSEYINEGFKNIKGQISKLNYDRPIEQVKPETVIEEKPIEVTKETEPVPEQTKQVAEKIDEELKSSKRPKEAEQKPTKEETIPEAEQVKEPYEMTREEFVKNPLLIESFDYKTVDAETRQNIKNNKEYNRLVKKAEQIKKKNPEKYKTIGFEVREPKEYYDAVELYSQEFNRVLHKNAVKEAVAEGKTISEEVLKDYPELKKEKTIPEAEQVSESGLDTSKKYRIGRNPQLWTIEEKLPKQEGDLPEETFYRIKNDKTGETEIIESSDLTPVKLKEKVNPEQHKIDLIDKKIKAIEKRARGNVIAEDEARIRINKLKTKKESLQETVQEKPEVVDEYKKAKQTLKSALKKDSGISFGGLSKLGDLSDPKVLKAVYTISKYHYENGAKALKDFSKKMIEEVGNWIKPHLRELLDNIKGESDLIARHNLFDNKLKFADEIGGIANPSFAITKKGLPFEKFGNITLVADKNMVNPYYKNTKVYGADVYSPRYPAIKAEINYDKFKELNDKVYSSYVKYMEQPGWRGKNALDMQQFEEYNKEGLYNDEYLRIYFLDEIIKEKNVDYTNSGNIRESIRKNETEYRKYIDKIFSEITGEKKIFKGFTYSGNRRYSPLTLENLSKELKTNLRGGEDFNYGLGTLRSKLTPEYKKINDIVKNKDKLLESSKFDEIKRDFEEELDKLVDTFEYSERGYSTLDNFITIIKDAIHLRKDIMKELDDFGFKNGDREKLYSFLAKLRTMPTEYFEAIVTRPVKLSEFKSAIVPENVSTETMSILEKNGIKDIRKYKNAEERQKIVEGMEEHSFGTEIEYTVYRKALKSLQEKINRPNMTFGLDTLPEVYQIAKYHTGNFIQWSKSMIEDVGNWIKPHLRKLWNEITKDRTGLENVVTQGIGKKKETVYHGGYNIEEDMTLKLGYQTGKYTGQDSGAIFFTPNKDYAKQYMKDDAGLYEYKIENKDKIFDATNDKHIKQLKEGFLKDWENEYSSKEDVLRDYEQATKLIKESINHNAVDWATASQWMEQIEKAGFEGAKFLERPAEKITGEAGNYKLEGNPVYSYAIFKDKIKVNKVITQGIGIPEIVKAQFRSRGKLPDKLYKQVESLRASQRANEFETKNFVRKFKSAILKEYGRKGLNDKQFAEQLNEYLKGNKNITLKPETKIAIDNLRNNIDKYSQDLLNTPILSKTLKDIVGNNLGTYLTRFYERDYNKKWKKFIHNTPEGQQIYNTAKSYLENQYKKSGRKITDEELAGELETLMQPVRDEFSPDFQRGKEININRDTLKQRKDIPEELRGLMGEFKDPLANYTRSVFKMGNMIEKAKLLSDMRNTGLNDYLFTKPVKNAKGEYTELLADKDNPAYKPLTQGKTDIYTTKEIKQGLEDAFKTQETNIAFKLYQQIMGQIRYGKTASSPVTTVRNVISNPVMMLANGYRNFHETGKYFKLSESEKKKLIKLNVIGSSANLGELKAVTQDIFRQGSQFESMSKSIKDKAKNVYDKPGELYGAIDDVFKAQAFEKELRRYKNAYKDDLINRKITIEELEKQVAEIVTDVLPTYSKVPSIIKNVIRRLPVGNFVSFPAEIIRTMYNIPRIALKEMQNPKTRKIGIDRMASYTGTLAIVSSLPLISRMISGVSEEEEQAIRGIVPDWQKYSQFIHLGKNDKGEYEFVDLSYTDPYNYIKKPFIAMATSENSIEGVAEGIKEFVSPFLSEEILAKVILDIRSNKNSETGKEIYSTEDNNSDIAMDMLGYVVSKASPGAVTLGQRLYKASEDEKGDTKRYRMKDELLSLTGHRKTTINVENVLKFKSIDLKNELDNIKSKATKIQYKYKDNPEQLEKELTKVNEILEEKYNKGKQLISDMKTLGATDEQIDIAMQYSGITAKDMLAITKGEENVIKSKAEVIKLNDELNEAGLNDYQLRDTKTFGEESKTGVINKDRLNNWILDKKEEIEEDTLMSQNYKKIKLEKIQEIIKEYQLPGTTDKKSKYKSADRIKDNNKYKKSKYKSVTK